MKSLKLRNRNGVHSAITEYIYGDRKIFHLNSSLTLSHLRNCKTFAHDTLEKAKNFETQLNREIEILEPKTGQYDIKKLKIQYKNLDKLTGYVERYNYLIAALERAIEKAKNNSKVLIPLLMASIAWLGYKNFIKNDEPA